LQLVQRLGGQLLSAVKNSVPMVQIKTGLIFTKKLLYGVAAGVCLLAACKKNCNNVEQELIDKAKSENPSCICSPYIKKYNWKGQVVYMRYISGAACDGIPFFYSGNGTQLSLPSGTTFDQFLAQSTLLEVVWSCNETPVTHQ
jgi:hypothetical protein